MFPAPALPGIVVKEPWRAPPWHGASIVGAATALLPATSMRSVAVSAIRTLLRYPLRPQPRQPVHVRERGEDPLPDDRQPDGQRPADHDGGDAADERGRHPRLECAELVRRADEDHLH